MRDGYHIGRRRGRYEANLYVGGERTSRFTLGTDSREDAERQVRQLNAQRERDALPAALTCDAIMGLYITDREQEGKAAIFRMKQCRAVLKPYFGAHLPEAIDKAMCTDFITKRRNLGVGNGTIRTELAYLSAALQFAVDMKMMKEKPRIWRPQEPRPRSHVEDFHLTRNQAARLLKECEQTPHLKLWVILALATAGRPLHILQLTWDRVDFHAGTINLDDPDRDRTAKGRARVAMNDQAREALLEAKRHGVGSASGHVIEFDGKPLKRMKGSLERAAKRARIEVSPYVLRHTAAVWMVESGVSLEEVAQILGHTNINTTYRIYARFRPGHQQKAVSHLQVVEEVRGSDGPIGPTTRNAIGTNGRIGTSA